MQEVLPDELEKFLHGALDPAQFRHADHIRVAFEMLRRHDFLDTARAYSNGLKALASKAGRPTADHETITLAFLSLIAERLDHHPNWSNVYNRVDLAITTHDAGGLTALDFEFARRVDAVLPRT